MALPFPAVVLFFSISDGSARAVTAQGAGPDFGTAWEIAADKLNKLAVRHRLSGRFLRLDWVEGVEGLTWGGLKKRLRDVKRNYSRRGIALDADFSRSFSEQELNANAMLYGGNQIFHCVVNENNFLLAAQQKYGSKQQISFMDDQPVWTFDTKGLYCGEDGKVHELYGRGRNVGRRQTEAPDIATLEKVIRDGSDYLARQVGPDGRFIYGYHPCFDREIPAYNALRHASTTYAMLESWEETRNPALMAAVERALDCLCRSLIHKAGDGLAFVVDSGNEIKLGANATAILAMSKYAELTGSQRFAELMPQLALGILHMQAKDGSFTHVLNWPGLELKEKFRIVYYEGEAAFALMRLYSLDNDPRWIAAVEQAFGHFIRNDYWKHHDHWLSYCTNELTIHRPELRYFQFGIRNFEGYLDFILQRITTFPTLLELMMAGRKMLDQLRSVPGGGDLLAAVDEEKFNQALHFRADYLLNGHFWPEYAMFFRNPDRILGAFFIRHHAFRVRIDDVEHYLSGLVSYLTLLRRTDTAALTTSAMQEAAPPPDPGAVLILSYPAGPRGFREANTLAEKLGSKGLKAFYASYRALPQVSDGVDGFAYDHGKWKPLRFVVPALIDNAPARNLSEAAFLKDIGQGRYISTHPLGGKAHTLGLLEDDARSRPWLIPSRAPSAAAVQELFAAGHDKLALKPLRSNRGRGVHILERRCDRPPLVHNSNGAHDMSEEAFNTFIGKCSGERWMLQDYISSLSADGRAFDIRVPLFRAGGGQWEAARVYARLGADGITSNLATGGSSHDAVPFLQRLMDHDTARALVAEMTVAARQMADVLQENYPWPLDALGFDFGIAAGRAWLFEVNAYPGQKGCLDSATDLRAAYFAHLAQQGGAHLHPTSANEGGSLFVPPPKIQAATPENRSLLQSVVDAGPNDFSKSPFLRKGMGNPVYSLIGREARARGLQPNLVNNTHLELLRGGRVVAVFSPNSPDLSSATRELAADKALTKIMLDRVGVPVPHGGVFTDLQAARSWLVKRARPQVVKPSRGYGGNGVSVGVASDADLDAAWARAQKYGHPVLIEDQLPGDELRIIILNGTVLAAVCRQPAFVTGDGVRSIRALVSEKNVLRQLNPLMRCYPIRQFDYLEKELGLDLEHVPKKDAFTRLASVSNVGLGGEAISLVEILHPSFHDFARRAFSAFPGATQLGLDIIARDFGADAFDDNAVIIEVNSDPAIGTPCFSAWGPPAADIHKSLLDYVIQRESRRAESLAGHDLAAVLPSVALPPCQTGDQQTAILRNAASRLGLQFETLSDSMTLVRTAGGERLFWRGMPHSTPHAARRISQDMIACDQRLAAHGLPVPKRGIFTPADLAKAQNFARDCGKPLLVAQRRNKYLSALSHNVQGEDAVARAFALIGGQARHILMTEELPTARQRLLMIDSILVAAALLGPDGCSEEISGQVHPRWSAVGAQVVSALLSPAVCGIDLCDADLSAAPEGQTWSVVAVDVDPDFSLHHSPKTGTARDVAGALLRRIAEV